MVHSAISTALLRPEVYQLGSRRACQRRGDRTPPHLRPIFLPKDNESIASRVFSFDPLHHQQYKPAHSNFLRTMGQLRSPLTPPLPAAAINSRFRLTKFRHPAYPTSEPELLQLVALDRADENDRTGGVDYDTALTACCIVSGNTFGDGFLGKRNGDEFLPVERPSDGILREKEYYFLLRCCQPHGIS